MSVRVPTAAPLIQWTSVCTETLHNVCLSLGVWVKASESHSMQVSSLNWGENSSRGKGKEINKSTNTSLTSDQHVFVYSIACYQHLDSTRSRLAHLGFGWLLKVKVMTC